MQLKKRSTVEHQDFGKDLYVKQSGTMTKIHFKDCKFSNCDFKRKIIFECVFERCEFSKCTFKESELVACKFTGCNFSGCDFQNSFPSNNIGSNAGEFINVNFVKCNFKGVYFYFPIIENVKFDQCNIDHTNFDGSRLKNVTFIGKMEGVWFRGYSIFARKSFLGIFNRVNPKKYRNKMDNVDFTQCKIEDASFSHGIDLSKTRFDPNANALYIENPKSFYEKVIEVIKSEWHDEDKQKGLKMMYGIFYNEKKWEQPNDYVDLTLSSYPELAYLEHRVFSLFRKVYEDSH